MKKFHPLLASLLSTLLMILPWYGFGGLTLVAALVPLLWLSDAAPKGRFWPLFLPVLSAFVLWCVVSVWWIWRAAPIGVVAAAICTAFPPALLVMLYHWASKRTARAVAYMLFIAGWVAWEYLYLNGQFSFPWLLLGHGFANDVWAVQWYEYTGALGGTLWVLLCNILIYNAIKYRNSKRIAFASLAVALPLAVSLVIYSSWKESGRSAAVTVVQPNIEPWTEKFIMSQADQTAILLTLAHEAPRDADFVVMPETAVNDDIWEDNIMYNATVQEFSGMAGTIYPNTLFIIGATTRRQYLSNPTFTARTYDTVNYWWDTYNSALAVDAANIGIYRKNKLVAGAEMIPYYTLLKDFRFLSIDIGGEMGQFGYGDAWNVFASPKGIRASVGICYESAYGEYLARFVRGGAEILAVITNDGWWGDTPGYRQHFSFSRLRAVETRRTVARSANTGISGFISPRGDVISKLGWDRRGTLTERVPLEEKITLYVRAGDYLGRIASYLFLLSLLYTAAYLVRRRGHIIGR